MLIISSGFIHETIKSVKKLILTLYLLFNLFKPRAYTGIESAWLGVHSIDGQHRNVNGDDFPEGVIITTDDPDNCLQLHVSNLTLPSLFHPCDNTRSMAGVCTRLKYGKCLHLLTLIIYLFRCQRKKRLVYQVLVTHHIFPYECISPPFKRIGKFLEFCFRRIYIYIIFLFIRL